MNANLMFPSGAMPYTIPAGLILNQAFSPQPINCATMGNVFPQQQLLATMSNLQHFANLNTQNPGICNGSGTNEGYSSPLPDIFWSKLSKSSSYFADEQFEERGNKSI
ncbi:hypothetical protein SLE2022_383610 [Rubroshorea leprosula]